MSGSDSDNENLPIETLLELRNNIQDQICGLHKLHEINQKISGVDEHINIIDSLIISDYKELCRHNNQSKHLEQLNQYIIIINNVIYNRCPHRWIIDEIDIDPDRSIQSKYCERCQLNFDK